MNTIYQKFSMLITSKLQATMGQRLEKRGVPRLGQAIAELMRTEVAITQVENKLHVLQEVLISTAQQACELDRIIDEFLLAGDEVNAETVQRELNRLHRHLLQIKKRSRNLTTQRDHLQSVHDRLEVKIALMGLDQHTLHEFLRRTRTESSHDRAPQWRVVEPDEI